MAGIGVFASVVSGGLLWLSTGDFTAGLALTVAAAVVFGGVFRILDHRAQQHRNGGDRRG